MNCRKRRIFSFLTSALFCSLSSFGCINCMEIDDNDDDIQSKSEHNVGVQLNNISTSQATVLECLGLIDNGHGWQPENNNSVTNRLACNILMIISKLIYNNSISKKKQVRFLNRLHNHIKFDSAKERADAILNVIKNSSLLTKHPDILDRFVDALCLNVSKSGRFAYEKNLRNCCNDPDPEKRKPRICDLYFFLRNNSYVSSTTPIILTLQEYHQKFQSCTIPDMCHFYQYQKEINRVIYVILDVIAPTKRTAPTALIGNDWVNDISNNHTIRLHHFDFVSTFNWE